MQSVGISQNRPKNLSFGMSWDVNEYTLENLRLKDRRKVTRVFNSIGSKLDKVTAGGHVPFRPAIDSKTGRAVVTYSALPFPRLSLGVNVESCRKITGKYAAYAVASRRLCPSPLPWPRIEGVHSVDARPCSWYFAGKFVPEMAEVGAGSVKTRSQTELESGLTAPGTATSGK